MLRISFSTTMIQLSLTGVLLLGVSGCSRIMKTDFRNIIEPNSKPTNWKTVDLERLYMTPGATQSLQDQSETTDDISESTQELGAIPLDRDQRSPFDPMKPAELPKPVVSENLHPKRVGSGVSNDFQTVENKIVVPNDAKRKSRLLRPIQLAKNSTDPNSNPNETQLNDAVPKRSANVVTLRAQAEDPIGQSSKVMKPLPIVQTTFPLGPLEESDTPKAGVVKNQFVVQNQFEPIQPASSEKKTITPVESSTEATPNKELEPNNLAASISKTKSCKEGCDCEPCKLKAFENELLAALDAQQDEKELTRHPIARIEPTSLDSRPTPSAELDREAKKSVSAATAAKPFVLPGATVKLDSNKTRLAKTPDSKNQFPSTAANKFKPMTPRESSETHSNENRLVIRQKPNALNEFPGFPVNAPADPKPNVVEPRVEPSTAIVEPPKALAWDDQLELTIEAFEDQIINTGLNDYRKPQLQRGLVILNALQERLTQGQIAIDQPQHRKYWQHQMNAILNMLKSSQFSGAENPNQVNAALTHLQDAVQELKGLAELKISTVEFCSQVNGYGQFVIMDSVFKTNDRTLVYCEIENFLPVRIQTDSKERFSFRTELKSSVEFLDSSGAIVHKVDFPVVLDEASNHRRDFYLHLPLTFEIESAGKYELRIRIEDMGSKKVADFSKPVVIR